MVPGHTAVGVFQGAKEGVIIEPGGGFLRKGQELCANRYIGGAFEICESLFEQGVFVIYNAAVIDSLGGKLRRLA